MDYCPHFLRRKSEKLNNLNHLPQIQQNRLYWILLSSFPPPPALTSVLYHFFLNKIFLAHSLKIPRVLQSLIRNTVEPLLQPVPSSTPFN